MLNLSRSIFSDFSHGGVVEMANDHSDRRSERRNYAVYRACRIIRGGQQEIGIIRNTSEGGAEIQVTSPYVIGEEIIYDDAQNGERGAKVAWHRADRIGVEHSSPLSIASAPASRRPRALRFEAGQAATVWTGNQFQRAEALNVSQTGACLLFEQRLVANAGSLASLSFDGQEYWASELRWVEKDLAGFRFSKPISVAVLSSILELGSRKRMSQK